MQVSDVQGVQLPDGSEVFVGNQFTLTISDLDITDLSGVPKKRLQGASPTVHEVAG